MCIKELGSDELIGIGQTPRFIHSPVTVDLQLTQRVGDGRITRGGHIGENRSWGEPKQIITVLHQVSDDSTNWS